MEINHNNVLVIFSGGQDSTTCLFWAKKEFANIEAITFDYGQRHKIELEAAKNITSKANIPHKIIKLDALQMSANALTTASEITTNPNNGLPTTFVPGRNIIFVTIAAAYAYEEKIPNLVLGVSQVDYSGYPDCRQDTISSLENTLRLGMEFPFKVHTPLIKESKKDTILIAQALGALPYLAYSHTCYKGQKPPCGDCPACKLRAKGFEEAGISDPLLFPF